MKPQECVKTRREEKKMEGHEDDVDKQEKKRKRRRRKERRGRFRGRRVLGQQTSSEQRTE